MPTLRNEARTALTSVKFRALSGGVGIQLHHPDRKPDLMRGADLPKRDLQLMDAISSGTFARRAARLSRINVQVSTAGYEEIVVVEYCPCPGNSMPS
jgi:hypothetical protein